MNFETERIDLCIDFLKKLKESKEEINGASRGDLCVMATGGGAYKYYDRLKEALGVDVVREDEMACLIVGMFLLCSTCIMPVNPLENRC